EDRSICIWQTDNGKLLGRKQAAHANGVTSLAFTPRGQLVSAGKDRRLVVWNVVSGGEGGRTVEPADKFEHRSNEVAQLGIDPTGRTVLFDEGRELRLMSLATHGIEGALVNPQGAANFSTFALFAPDGKTVLTNSSAVGRLQLWRTPKK